MKTSRLRNGLRLAASPVAGTSFVHLSLAVKVGSRYEPPGRSGYSHFVEHLLFRGCEGYPSSFRMNEAFERLGDGLEGGTTREFSAFSISVPPANLPETLELLVDLMARPLLSGVETEKGIIYEEMLEELDENGDESDLDNISRGLVFGAHPLGQPVLGRKAQLGPATERKLRAWFDRYYRPERMVLAAAGKVDPAAFFSLARGAFGGWKGRGPAAPERSRPAPRRLVTGKGPVTRFREKAQSQVEVLLTFLAEGERSPGYPALMALERALDDGLSSRLQRSLCERRGLVYDISALLEGYTDIGLVDFSFRIAEKNAIVALTEILRELRTLRERPVGPAELEKVKSRMWREAVALHENPRFLSQRMAEHALLGLGTPLSLEQWERAIRSLTADDLREAAERVFRRERLVAIFEGEIPPADRRALGKLLEISI